MKIDFEAMTIEKRIDLVFTEMVYRMIQQLEEVTPSKKDETDGNQWTNNELSEIRRDYFEPCSICRWFPKLKEHCQLTILLHDYIISVCKLKYNLAI